MILDSSISKSYFDEIKETKKCAFQLGYSTAIKLIVLSMILKELQLQCQSTSIHRDKTHPISNHVSYSHSFRRLKPRPA